MTTLRGVIPILATPFHDDETLDLRSWSRMIEFMIELGVDGITILGVLGESNRVSDEERATLIHTAVSTVRKRIPVIVGTSHTGSRVVEYLSRAAANLGADAVMVTPAREAVPSDERVIESFRRLSEAVPISVVLQDHPASSDVHMTSALIARLLQAAPRIICVKEEAVPTAAKIRQLRELTRDSPTSILTGLGALYAPFDLEAGSDGFNTGFAFPEVLTAMVLSARTGDWSRVYSLYRQFSPLIVLEQQPGVAIRKEILRRRGLIESARARHPGVTITAAAAKQVDRVLSLTLPGIDITKPLNVDEAMAVAS